MTTATIPLCEPYLSGRESTYVRECLESGCIATAGSFISRFEAEVARFTGSPHAVGVASGTAALHLALLVAGIEPEEEVLVPTLTFIAPVNAIRYLQAHPVFMDVDSHTWQLDVNKVESFLKKECEWRNSHWINKQSRRKVTAILAVHLLGLSCEMDSLARLAQTYSLPLIEDAAEALGVRYRSRHVGTFGEVGALSFNANKLVTAGNGGMVLTSDPKRAERIRYLATQAKDEPNEFFHSAIGYNYRLTNVHAAIGLAQMEEIATRIAKKKAIAACYEEVLKNFPGLSRMPSIPNVEATYWLYTFLLAQGQQRQALLTRFHQAGIMARPLFHPVHQLPPYRTAQAFQIEVAPALYARGICLPSGLGLGEAELTRVVGLLTQFLKGEVFHHVK